MKYKKYFFETLSSTNDKAKELALDEEEGTVIITEEQTKGRGRFGRSWYSSRGKDILLSIIVKPNLDPRDMQKIVLIAAAAVNMALKDIGISSQIKWPNDIIIDGKKVGGILMEAAISGGEVTYGVLGIGINVNQETNDIPDQLKNKSTSLRIVTNKKIDKEELMKFVLHRFGSYYMDYKDRGNIEDVIDICRENSAIIGREVFIIQGNNGTRKGFVIDINMNGELLVDFPQGLEKISSGDLSIRGQDSYI